MNTSLLKSLLILILFSSFQLFLTVPVVAKKLPLPDPPAKRSQYTVYVINLLPSDQNKLIVHCASGNDDLGYHTLAQDEYFDWSFKMNVGGTTLYFCHFWWGNRDKRFDVFTRDFAEKHCISTFNCYWIANEDGFYFSNDYVHHPGDAEKLQEW